jgi:RNA polymerase sigma-70 factor (ECF subfamily)
MANCWHDHLRQRRDVTDIDDVAEADLPTEESAEDGYLQSQMIRRVRQAVGELPLGQREVITLVDLEECSYAAVAAILNIPVGTVMSRLSRARYALKEKLREPVAVAAVHKISRFK